MPNADSLKSTLGRFLDTGRTEGLLRLAVTLVLLVMVARSGAELTWQLGAPLLLKGRTAPPGQMPRQDNAPNPQSPPNRLLPPAEEIALFGQAAAVPATPLGSTSEAAPATTLNLVLKGVVAVHPMRRALAVIAERGSATEKLYAQGEEIAGNTVIREIHPDRVIISRAGTRETLFLDGLKNSATTAGEAPPPPRAGVGSRDIQPAGNGTNWRIAPNYWQEKLADVPGLAREVGVQIYSENNQQKGYRLLSVQNSKLLTDLGLQTGDILLSVNGRAMNSIQEGLAAYQQVKNGGQVTIEINRNGQRESRVYNIGG